MGCSTSKLEDEEAVQLCKDRKRFIKQAVEQRSRFASGHLAYIHSLKRVSAALREYVDGDEPREFLLDSFLTTPPFKKSAAPKFITISPNSFTKRNAIQSAASHSTLNVHYLRSGGEQAVSVEERPQSPEIVRVQAYYLRSGGEQAVSVEERPQSPEIVRVQAYSPMQYYGFDGFFGVQSSPMNSSFMSYNNGYNMPPPSPPQSSQWDGFWNPFSSLDFYGYAMRSSLDQMVMDDDIRGIRQVREEEGIPDLEDDSEQEVGNNVGNAKDEKQHKVEVNSSNNKEEVLVEDVDEEEEEEDDGDSDCDSGIEFECEGNALKSQCRGEIDLSRAQNSEVCTREMAVGEGEGKVETPGFTVYVNRRPTSMAEVIKDLEEQFTIVCNAAKEVSALLESGRAPHSSNTSELTALKLMNPVALFRSASRSSSSRFLLNSASSKEEDYESSSELSEETSMFSGHKSTLDRLYEWEKRLYEEVRAAEKVRIAYEKKCKQFRNQDINGEDPSAVDKTRAALRDLHTQLKISIHSVEAISKRIETLRDEELQPQLLELLQGMARMWKVMAECHQSQKQTLDQAKLLLAGTPSKLAGKRSSYVSDADPQRLARSASNLETELRNWRSCFEVWITSHRSYMHALAGWLLRCVRCDPDTSKFPFSPRRSSGTFPMLGLCIQWSRFLDSTQEMSVVDGLDFFAAGMGSLYAQQLRDDSQKVPIGSKRYGHESGRNMEIVEFGEVEEVVTKEKMAEVGIRVLCAGMSVAMSSLSEFATRCAEGNAELVKQWENAKLPQNSN